MNVSLRAPLRRREPIFRCSRHFFEHRDAFYCNVLLVEQPNTDFAYSITRQFLFDVYHLLLLTELQHSNDETLQAVEPN